MKTKLLILALLMCLTVTACTKPEGYGDTEIHISYTANGSPLVMDTLCYVNEAGNRYLVTEIQWFISKITLVSEQGDEFVIGHREASTPLPVSQEKVFYIDTNIPESQRLVMAPIPCQRYVSMRFTFGLDT